MPLNEAPKRSVLIPVRLWHKNGALPQSRTAPRASGRARPLDAAALQALALHYVGRYATTRHRLADYLRRKLRERGWVGEDDPAVDAVADRCVAAGFVDDRAFAEARAAALGRKGYGGRRIAQALQGAGIARDVAKTVAPDAEAALTAARAYVERRRIGICATGPVDRLQRDRQFAAMVRAGHDFDIVRRFLRDPEMGQELSDY